MTAASSLGSHASWLGAALALAIGLGGCTATRQAPVFDRLPPARTAKPTPAPGAPAARRPAEAAPGHYIVRRGDTLYSIALDHGLDYRELAEWNGVDATRIYVGQDLRLTPPPGTATTAPLRQAAPTVEARPLAGAGASSADRIKSQPRGVRVPYSDDVYAQMAAAKPPPAAASAPNAVNGGIDWMWPAAGRIISGFNEDGKLKGITIAGKLGEPVVASAAGRVIFSGTGIRGFGKLIVIKHNDMFLSVYGHNSALLVKEGERVARGQKIAEMGSTDADEVELHFEIRRLGKPVDPVKLLPERHV